MWTSISALFRAVHDAAMSLSPPRHAAVSRPGVFCWEDDAISLLLPSLLWAAGISEHCFPGWLWLAHSSLFVPHTFVRHFPGALPDGALPLFFLQVENYIYTVKCKEHECCGAQGLKGSVYSWLLCLCHPNNSLLDSCVLTRAAPGSGHMDLQEKGCALMAGSALPWVHVGSNAHSQLKSGALWRQQQQCWECPGCRRSPCFQIQPFQRTYPGDLLLSGSSL